MKGNAMLMPAVWGGLLIGVLSALPFVNLANLCCCLWVVAGGMVAAYVLQSNTPQAITTGDGALVGLLAGIIGAVVHTVVSLPINLLMGGVTQRLMQQIVNTTQDMPDNVRQMMESMSNSTAFSIAGVVVGFIFWLFCGAIFAALGGLLGAVFFKKKTVASA
ncbi:MAG: hypothetical protein NT151_01565 [Acidobacteria bacterium]|nr:hypothetical protein [Acidobacteriota bacterium]